MERFRPRGAERRVLGLANRQWLLSCGHAIPLLEHEQPRMPPRRPRMCATCGRPREIVSFAKPGVLVCVECGTTSEDGHGWRTELAPDDEGDDVAEVPVYGPDCWHREFGE